MYLLNLYNNVELFVGEKNVIFPNYIHQLKNRHKTPLFKWKRASGHA